MLTIWCDAMFGWCVRARCYAYDDDVTIKILLCVENTKFLNDVDTYSFSGRLRRWLFFEMTWKKTHERREKKTNSIRHKNYGISIWSQLHLSLNTSTYQWFQTVCFDFYTIHRAYVYKYIWATLQKLVSFENGSIKSK